MATMPPFLVLLWVISGIVQLCVLFLVFSKHHFRALPLFTIYITFNLCQAAFLLFVYTQFGFLSPAARRMYWISEPLALTAQALAATELLYLLFRHYPGIWALAWRLVATASIIVIAYATASARTRPDWALLSANRGYHLTFAVALVCSLLLVRSYALPFDPVYKAILAGFCVFSCTVVAANTLLEVLFTKRFPKSGEIWNYIEMVVFIGVQMAWAAALRHRVAADDKPALFPPATYERMSPEVNSRLRSLNDVLSRFLRLQVLQP